LGAPLLSFSSANPRENSHRIHDLNTLGAFQDETKKATGSLFWGGQGGGDPMALCGLREIRSWGHFSLLKHLFLCAERKFVATDLRLPSWDITSPGQAVMGGNGRGYTPNSLVVQTRAGHEQ